jgi:hypothetical protein
MVTPELASGGLDVPAMAAKRRAEASSIDRGHFVVTIPRVMGTSRSDLVRLRLRSTHGWRPFDDEEASRAPGNEHYELPPAARMMPRYRGGASLSPPSRSLLDELREQFARTFVACDAGAVAGPAEMRAAIEAVVREVETLLAVLGVVQGQDVDATDQDADELARLTLELQRRFSKLPAHAHRSLMEALRRSTN